MSSSGQIKISYVFLLWVLHECCGSVPIVINTWNFSVATKAAWQTLQKKGSPIEALEAGCSACEVLQCDGTVGYGGSPDEDGETTLDALIFDGKTMNMGAVGALRRIKNAISVAKAVMQHTSHSLLVGDQATKFAIEMGFQEETLRTNHSHNIWTDWKRGNCQPNYWTKVVPNHMEYCGPYTPRSNCFSEGYQETSNYIVKDSGNHDTIGMVIVDESNNVVAGTSTNGLKYKIPGRVGDSPIPGAGAYADNACGGAAATGDGDVMMRFLPSFLAVEEMRKGASPTAAAEAAISRIVQKYPDFFGGVIAVNVLGEYGAACNGMDVFPFSIANAGEIAVKTVACQSNELEVIKQT